MRSTLGCLSRVAQQRVAAIAASSARWLAWPHLVGPRFAGLSFSHSPSHKLEAGSVLERVARCRRRRNSRSNWSDHGSSGSWLASCALRQEASRSAEPPSVFGLVAAQYGAYWRMYADDHRWIKIICAVVMCATTLKAFFDCASLWIAIVPGWIAGNAAEMCAARQAGELTAAVLSNGRRSAHSSSSTSWWPRPNLSSSSESADSTARSGSPHRRACC